MGLFIAFQVERRVERYDAAASSPRAEPAKVKEKQGIRVFSFHFKK